MSKNDMRASIDKSEGVERRELGNVQKNNQVSTSFRPSFQNILGTSSNSFREVIPWSPTLIRSAMS